MNPAPKIDCKYEVVDLLTNRTLTEATANYWQSEKSLELTNVKNNSGYSLKINGTEVIKLITEIGNLNKSFTKHVFFNPPKKEIRSTQLEIPSIFMNSVLVWGKEYLQIDTFM